VLVLASLAGCATAADGAADLKVISGGEAAWAKAIAAGDVAAVERLLDDDDPGVAPDGSRTDQNGELEGTRAGAPRFVSNPLVGVQVHFLGDNAVAQGAEHGVKSEGASRSGRYAWSDTGVRRNGRRILVAAADIEVPDPPAATP
jgi:hypothetical protein